MCHLKFMLRSCAFIAAMVPAVVDAQVQMLPPIQSGTLNTVCPNAGANNFLTWDGATALKCQVGVVVDNAGRVGIGTTAPIRQLDVNGAIRMNNNNVGGLLAGANPGTGGWPGKEFLITLADGAGTNNDGIWIGPNVSAAAGGLGWVRLHANRIAMTGNNVAVGIGNMEPAAKLDVAGGVKIGMDSSACVPAKAGTLRYNAGQVQVCNGTSWSGAFGGTTTYAIANEGTVNMGAHKFCGLTRVQSAGWGSATAWYCEILQVDGIWTLRSHFQRDAENMPKKCSCRAMCMD